MSDAPKYFSSPIELREWFNKNAQFESALLVGFYKTSSGIDSVTMPEAIDEALCVGWLEVARQALDAKRYTVRFTRRKQNSTWTEIHLKRHAVLVAQGRMKPAGMAVFKSRPS
jgi:uncharacterized protein YdeI (YjbR/CyaY-like superfamily)